MVGANLHLNANRIRIINQVKPRNLQKQGTALPHIRECWALFSLERVFKDLPANKNTTEYQTVLHEIQLKTCWYL
jgi:hypothetical protein